MSRSLLGIVVPVYNTEKNYLLPCLSSLAAGEAPVVVVDDGSDELTAALCEDFCAKRPGHFTYVRQSNEGQNSARITGTGLLRTKYVMFVDSDDRLTEHAIPLLIRLLESYSPDMLTFGFIEAGQSTDRGNWEQNPVVREVDKKKMMAERASLWGAVFKRADVVRIGLATGFHVGEDFASAFALAALCERIASIDLPLYLYAVRPSSVTQDARYPYALEVVRAFDYLMDKNLDREYMPELEWQAIKHLRFWEPLRLIRSHQATRARKSFLDSYMSDHFPGWQENPYYVREAGDFGPDFHLLVRGHWKLYEALWKAKAMLRRSE